MVEGDKITREDIISDVFDRFQVDLKDKQVEVLDALLVKKQDIIFIAKTGYGKSITFHAGPLVFDPPKIALIIMPLKALEDQQCMKLAMIKGCRPFVLNGESNRPVNLQSIAAGYYTHSK